jgi:hypothetical protein
MLIFTDVGGGAAPQMSISEIADLKEDHLVETHHSQRLEMEENKWKGRGECET